MKLKLSADVLALNPGAASSIAVEADAKAAQRARLPRAAAESPTGLTALVAQRGWSVDASDSFYRLYKIGQPVFDTGRCADEASACKKAKEMEQRQ